MAENEQFTPIDTQEEFDAAVAARYGDVGSLQAQVETLTGERDGHAATIAGLQKEIDGYKLSNLKQQITREKGIPAEMADRLTGETEKDIRTDADKMVGVIRAVKGPDPTAQTEQPTEGNTTRAAFRAMLRKMKGE